jgi:hypothetical protein
MKPQDYQRRLGGSPNRRWRLTSESREAIVIRLISRCSVKPRGAAARQAATLASWKHGGGGF